ncbi:tyrosine-type recombinase/integrase [Achromobacter sp. PAB15]|uniref:tyrosine-type recombinase/integrase n=1 Tax=Achromobacter sp. PAB15 TaxID=3233048 RepID=UPI003F8F2078
MAQKITGLYQEDGIWHIDKQIKGIGRIRGSTGTSSRKAAETRLQEAIDEARAAAVSKKEAIRSPVFREAATRYLKEYAHQRSIWLSATYLKQVDPYIGGLQLHEIDSEALEPYIEDRLEAGIKARTVNIALQRVVRVLNLCQRKWRTAEKRPWLNAVPLIEMLDERTSRKPYPISWDEEDLLMSELPLYLKRMALYTTNTGCREQEVCKLRWEWEIHVPELRTSVFLLPADFGGRFDDSGVKNREERLVVLNDVASEVIRLQRGLDKEWVFPFEGGPMSRMNATAWRSARKRAASAWEKKYGKPAHPDFARLRVHDLKHTFGRRLRAADVSHEDRQVLLGHTNGSVTSHYSAAELGKLIELANRITRTNDHTPTLTVLRRQQ